MEIAHDHHVDIKDMCCSAPVIHLSREFKRMKSGEIALVESNKVSMLNDIPSYCSLTHNELVGQAEEHGLYYFWIRIG